MRRRLEQDRSSKGDLAVFLGGISSLGGPADGLRFADYGRILLVQGARLKKWIENGRQEWKGPSGLFSRRPMIGD